MRYCTTAPPTAAPNRLEPSIVTLHHNLQQSTPWTPPTRDHTGPLWSATPTHVAPPLLKLATGWAQQHCEWQTVMPMASHNATTNYNDPISSPTEDRSLPTINLTLRLPTPPDGATQADKARRPTPLCASPQY
nr:uncharacterized protein CTRU02_06402 [Colletotrichum truncatum]KAF6792906.1 hypothetical protein CTRU02_06402 [Colletotrichum truncatum]